MKAFWARLFITALTILFTAAVSLAGTLQGTVINRTTGQPVGNVDVDVLSPTQGMALQKRCAGPLHGHEQLHWHRSGPHPRHLSGRQL